MKREDVILSLSKGEIRVRFKKCIKVPIVFNKLEPASSLYKSPAPTSPQREISHLFTLDFVSKASFLSGSTTTLIITI